MPSFADARDHREVLLDDGRTGRLQHISRRSRIATVVIGGRRYRLPASQIRTFWVHRPPLDGILPCCSKSASWIPPEDRISPIPAAVTCPGQVSSQVEDKSRNVSGDLLGNVSGDKSDDLSGDLSEESPEETP